MRPLAALLLLLALWSPAAADPVAFPGLYPEGPVVIGGDLYVAEMTGHRVTRLREDPAAPSGFARDVFFQREGCGPTALAEIADDRIVVLCHLEGALAVVDRKGALLQLVTESADGVRLDSPNDIGADGQGGAFFSNAGVFHPNAPSSGRLMRIGPDLTVTTAASGLRYANGVVVDPERGRIYVSEHLAQRVLSFPLDGGESAKRPIVLIERETIAAHVSLDDPLTGPDGIEVAPDGSILVAIYGGGAYLRLDKDGAVTAEKAQTRYLCSLAVWGDRLALAGAFSNRIPPFEGLIELRPGP